VGAVRKISTPTPNFREIIPRPCCSGRTRFPVKTNISNIFSPKSRRLKTVTNFFQKQFFHNIEKTVRDIENMKRIKFVGLLIYNNLLPGHILISITVSEIQGSKNLKKKHPSPLILGKYCPNCAVQHLLLISTENKYFNRTSTKVRTFLEPLAPDKLFSKTVFFKISQKPFEINIHVYIKKKLKKENKFQKF